MKPRVAVLLAAYNGEKFLEEQIESILAQEGDFSLLLRIRDDGSTDGTPRIGQAYQERFPDKVEYIRGENLGYNGCFFALLDGAEGFDYIALSDQDDKWMPGKLRAALSLLKGEEGPALYACPSVMTDRKLKPLGMTRQKKRPLLPANTLIQNICPGHNQVLNAPLLKLVQRPRRLDQIYVYDLWIANLASLYGKILFDPTPRTWYRQHGDNELGSRSSSLGKLLKAGQRSLQGEGKKNQRQMAYFAEENREALKEQGCYEGVQSLLKADSFGKRLRFVLRCPFYRQSRLETLAFKLAVLLGRY